MKSEAEEAFWAACTAPGGVVLPLRELRFDASRKWRFDFAWPDQALAVEIEGSGHRSIVTFRKDTEKYNAAIAQGWRVMRFLGCDYKPSRSRAIYPDGAADWYREVVAVLCGAR